MLKFCIAITTENTPLSKAIITHSWNHVGSQYYCGFIRPNSVVNSISGRDVIGFMAPRIGPFLVTSGITVPPGSGSQSHTPSKSSWDKHLRAPPQCYMRNTGKIMCKTDILNSIFDIVTPQYHPVVWKYRGGARKGLSHDDRNVLKILDPQFWF